LDIKRKHHRLLTVEPHPAHLALTAVGIDRYFSPIRGAGGWVRANNEILLGLLQKGAPQPRIQFTPFIGFDEPETGMSHVVLEALDQFAGLAHSIIKRFDIP
jgi:hypothetical protein